MTLEELNLDNTEDKEHPYELTEYEWAWLHTTVPSPYDCQYCRHYKDVYGDGERIRWDGGPNNFHVSRGDISECDTRNSILWLLQNCSILSITSYVSGNSIPVSPNKTLKLLWGKAR